MKTLLYSRNGRADAVLEFRDKPKPVPQDGEVLVKLETSGVNPSDVKSRAGRPFAFDFVVPHSDGAGIIEAVGPNVDGARVGERVWIWNGQWQRQYGTAAEFIAVPSAQAVHLDDAVDFETAACFGIPGVTAAHAVNLLATTKCERVLVTGAASSVGHYVVQMASMEGKQVIGTASEAKADTVLEAGASSVIDYRKEDVGEKILELTDGAGVDAVIDMDFYSTSRLVSSSGLRSHGTIICYGSNDMGEIPVAFRDLLFKSLTLKFFLVYELLEHERSAAVERLGAFMQSGKAKTRISHVLPFEEAVKAHELVESGNANGNVVLKV
ncbi:MAG: NADPH:quinone reductase [Rhizobiaceae bacterium]|jgi:NADPH2:quinone reductase|nr:NADPH:quinone reductase [Rhizobiaceae bacterium]